MPDTQSPAVGHTPGPYEIGHGGLPGDTHFTIVSKLDGRKVLAEYASPDPRPSAEVVANARLFAASPELLAALKDVLAAQAAGQLSYKSSGGCGYEAMLAVESAIAKAEGRAS